MTNPLSGIGGFLSGLIKPVADIGSQYLRHRAEGKERNHSLKMARINAKIRAAEREAEQAHDLDREASRERRESFKDEVLMGIIVWPIVLVLSIVTIYVITLVMSEGGLTKQGMLDALAALEIGMDALRKQPEYMVLVGLLFVAIYGYRGLLRKWINIKAGGVTSILQGRDKHPLHPDKIAENKQGG